MGESEEKMKSAKWLVLSLVLLTACGETSGPVTGINFQIAPDPGCSLGTPNLGLLLFVDGVQRARDALSIGEFSIVIRVAVGDHTAQAKEDTGPYGYAWPQQRVTVIAGQITTVRLACGG